MLQVQVFISELTRGGNQGASGTGQQRAEPQQQQQQQRPQQQQQRQQQPEQQHTHANGTSTTDQAPRGMGGEGLRQRHAASRSSAPQQRQQQQQQQALPPEDPSVTPEQRRVVARILEAKCYYEVLGVSRDAGDPDIKTAYKKVSAVLLCGSSLQPPAAAQLLMANSRHIYLHVYVYTRTKHTNCCNCCNFPPPAGAAASP